MKRMCGALPYRTTMSQHKTSPFSSIASPSARRSANPSARQPGGHPERPQQAGGDAQSRPAGTLADDGGGDAEQALPTAQVSGGGRAVMLKVFYTKIEQLAASYIPIFKSGGLFIPREVGALEQFGLGHHVFLCVLLPGTEQDSQEPPGQNVYNVACTVAWITPANAGGGRLPGIGLAFRADVNAAASARLDERIQELTRLLVSNSRPVISGFWRHNALDRHVQTV